MVIELEKKGLGLEALISLMTYILSSNVKDSLNRGSCCGF